MKGNSLVLVVLLAFSSLISSIAIYRSHQIALQQELPWPNIPEWYKRTIVNQNPTEFIYEYSPLFSLTLWTLTGAILIWKTSIKLLHSSHFRKNYTIQKKISLTKLELNDGK